MSIFLLFLGLAPYLTQVHAAVGLELPRSELLPQACLVKLLDAEGNLKEICSGTLLRPQLLHSAGHCFDGRNFDPKKGSVQATEVVCPNGSRTRIVGVRFAPLYSEEQARREDALRRFDSSLAELADPVDMPAPAMQANGTLLKELLSHTKACAIFGYGGRLFTDPELELLRGTHVDPSAVTLHPNGLLYVKGIGGSNSGLVQGGDSGGSFSCRDPGNGQWVHVADVSAMDYDYGSLLAPLATNHELFASIPEEAGEAQTSANALLGFLREEIRLELYALERVLSARKASLLAEWKERSSELMGPKEASGLLSSIQAERLFLLRGTVGSSVRLKPFTRVVLDFSSPSGLSLLNSALLPFFQPEKNPFSLGDQSANRFLVEAIVGEEAVGKLQIFGDSEYFAYRGCKENVLCSAGLFERVRVPLQSIDASSLR